MAVLILVIIVTLAWGLDVWRTRALEAQGRIKALEAQVQLRDELLDMKGAGQ